MKAQRGTADPKGHPRYAVLGGGATGPLAILPAHIIGPSKLPDGFCIEQTKAFGSVVDFVFDWIGLLMMK
jgi:hypothetical protein